MEVTSMLCMSISKVRESSAVGTSGMGRIVKAGLCAEPGGASGPAWKGISSGTGLPVELRSGLSFSSLQRGVTLAAEGVEVAVG